MSFGGPPGFEVQGGRAQHGASVKGGASLGQSAMERVERVITIPMVAQNPSLVVTDLNFAVPLVAQRHFDLIASSKTNTVCFVNTSQVQQWDAGQVKTLYKSSGQILDIAFSPHFDTFISTVDEFGEAIIQDITQARATFRLVPRQDETSRPLLKSVWHPAKPTILATAYQDGLICIWDLSEATQYANKVVLDGVTTYERPSNVGVAFPDAPSLLVVIRAPEGLTDVALVGDYIITTSSTGVIRIYHTTRGDLQCEMPGANAGNVVVVSEVPFVFVTGSLDGNSKLKVWRASTTSPLRFALLENFAFDPIPLPASHPAHRTPFKLLRQSSKGMIIVTHPALCAVWIIPVNGTPLTFGARQPFNGLCTPDPTEGFIGLNEMMAVSVKFSTTPTDPVSLIPSNLDRLAVSQTVRTAALSGPSAYTAVTTVSTTTTTTTTGGASVATTLPVPTNLQHAPVEGEFVSLSDLRGILEKQNEVCLEGIRQMREVSVLRQNHVLKCLKELPSAIMSSLSPILEQVIETQAKSTDANHIANNVAEAVKEPAAMAMGSYFREALIPGFQQACHFMTQDVSDVLETASASMVSQLLPIHTAKVIDPLVQGLASASTRISASFRDSQSSLPSQTQGSSSTTITTAPTSIHHKVGASTAPLSAATASTASPAPSDKKTAASTTTAVITPVSKPPVATVSTTSSVGALSTPPVATNTTTPAKKKKSISTPAASPAPTAVSVPTSSSNNATASTPSITPPKEETPPPPVVPRPEPLPTKPVSDSTRTSIMGLVSQKSFNDAINLVMESGTVEALGFLTSRTDMTQWVDTIAQSSLRTLLSMIVKQTMWPSPGQVQKYAKTVNLILSKLDASQLAQDSTSSELLAQTRQWTSGTPVETSSHLQIELLESR